MRRIILLPLGLVAALSMFLRVGGNVETTDFASLEGACLVEFEDLRWPQDLMEFYCQHPRLEDSDPVEFILERFPELTKIIDQLGGPAYKEPFDFKYVDPGYIITLDSGTTGGVLWLSDLGDEHYEVGFAESLPLDVRARHILNVGEWVFIAAGDPNKEGAGAVIELAKSRKPDQWEAVALTNLPAIPDKIMVGRESLLMELENGEIARWTYPDRVWRNVAWQIREFVWWIHDQIDQNSATGASIPSSSYGDTLDPEEA